MHSRNGSAVKRLMVAMILWGPGFASAQGSSSSAPAESVVTGSSSAGQIVSVLLALGGIVALILALSWFVRRAGGGWMRSPHMKVVATLALGTRERLVLVDVGGQQLLLGITPHNVNSIHHFEEPVVVPEEAASSDFAQKLMAAMSARRPQNSSGEQNNESGRSSES